MGESIGYFRDAYAREQLLRIIWQRCAAVYRFGTDSEKEIISKILKKEELFEHDSASYIDEKSKDINNIYFRILERRGSNNVG